MQVRVAAEEYHAEFAQKEATIAMLTSDAEAQKAQMQQKIDQLRRDMEVSQALCYCDELRASCLGFKLGQAISQCGVWISFAMHLHVLFCCV